jgi:hypothetical protein
LGVFPHHSTNVILVLNSEKGSITPQDHVGVDEKFSTTSTVTDAEAATSVVTLSDNIRDNGYDQHDSLLGPRDAPITARCQPGTCCFTNTDAQTPELPPAIEMQAETFPEMDDPFELPQQDASTNPEVIVQVEPITVSLKNKLSCLRTPNSSTPPRLRSTHHLVKANKLCSIEEPTSTSLRNSKSPAAMHTEME